MHMYFKFMKYEKMIENIKIFAKKIFYIFLKKSKVEMINNCF